MTSPLRGKSGGQNALNHTGCGTVANVINKMSKRRAKQNTPVRKTRDNCLELFIEQIRSANSIDRDHAATRIREFTHDAVDALWRSIKKPANINRRGTMARALQVFNCADRSEDLLNLAIDGNYEVQCHALRILQTQSFSVTPAQFRLARKQVSALRPRKNLTAEAIDLLRPELDAVLQRLRRT